MRPGVAAVFPLASVTAALSFHTRTASFSAAEAGVECKAAASRAMDKSPAPRRFTRALANAGSMVVRNCLMATPQS